MSQAAFRTVISGRVQLVMYRDYIQRNAQKLHILGEVKNLPNGTVEVFAEGEKEALESLIAIIKKGPVLAKVNDMHVVWQEPTGAFKSFSINFA